MPTATDARRLVLGAAVGFRVDQVRIFVESLRASGYTGDVAMLVGLTDFELAAYLRRYGVSPKRTWFIRRFHGPIHAYRFQLFADYLRAHRDRYDEVLISDVRDVAFQAHPSRTFPARPSIISSKATTAPSAMSRPTWSMRGCSFLRATSNG